MVLERFCHEADAHGPGSYELKTYKRITCLKWQQIKLLFPLKERWWEPPRPLFWKQNDSNEKNLCTYLLAIAFLRFREHCPRGLLWTIEFCAFAESNLKRMLGSYLHTSADIFSNVKLLMCQQSGPAPTQAGESAYLGRARPGSPLSGSHTALNQKGGPPARSSLCWGLVPVWRGTLICPNSGTDQSDSAQKPKLNDIFEGLQVYYLQVQIAIPDDRERRRQSYVAWRILEVLW